VPGRFGIDRSRSDSVDAMMRCGVMCWAEGDMSVKVVEGRTEVKYVGSRQDVNDENRSRRSIAVVESC
jgi:hypothetical protein